MQDAGFPARGHLGSELPRKAGLEEPTPHSPSRSLQTRGAVSRLSPQPSGRGALSSHPGRPGHPDVDWIHSHTSRRLRKSRAQHPRAVSEVCWPQASGALLSSRLLVGGGWAWNLTTLQREPSGREGPEASVGAGSQRAPPLWYSRGRQRQKLGLRWRELCVFASAPRPPPKAPGGSSQEHRPTWGGKWTAWLPGGLSPAHSTLPTPQLSVSGDTSLPEPRGAQGACPPRRGAAGSPGLLPHRFCVP